METVGSELLDNWCRIDNTYRATCRKIISFSFTKNVIEASELKKLLTKGDVDDVEKAVESLVKANILSKIGGGKYSIHSNLEKEYLAANMYKLI